MTVGITAWVIGAARGLPGLLPWRMAPAPRETGRLRPRTEALLALAVLAGSALLFIAFIRDPTTLDDRRYFVNASKILDGVRSATQYYEARYRLGILMEVAVARSIFGYDAAAYYLVAIGNSVLAVGGAYLLVRLFFPAAVAVLTALLFATSPYYLSFASWLNVDWPATAALLFAIGFAVLALRADPARSRAFRYAFAAGAGAAFWLALWIKASVAPVYPLMIGLLWLVPLDRASAKAIGVMAAAFGAAFAFELALNLYWFGHALTPYQLVAKATTFEYSKRTYLDHGHLPSNLTWADLVWRYPQMMWSQAPGRLFMVLSVAGMLIAAVTRQRALLFWALLGIVSWAAISLAVTHTDPLAPVLRTKFRYITTPFAFWSLLPACAAWTLYGWARPRARWLGGRFALGVLAALAVGIALYQFHYVWRHPLSHSATRRASWDSEGVFQRIEVFAREGIDGGARPVKRIVSDGRSVQLIQMFVPGGAAQVVQMDGWSSFTFVNLDDFQPGDLVYVQYPRLRGNQGKYYTNRVPDFVFNPPPHWRPVWLSPGSRGARGGKGKGGAHRIYYVLPREEHPAPRD